MTQKKEETIEEVFLSKIDSKLRSKGITIIHDVEPYYDLIKARFPIETSRIGWELIPDAIESSTQKLSAFYGIDKDAACKRFLSEQILLNALSGRAYLVNDSLDIVLDGDVAAFEEIFESILGPPGHIYLLGEKGNWCLNVTFENDLYFGFAPPNENNLH